MNSSHWSRVLPVIFLAMLIVCYGCAAVVRQNPLVEEARLALAAAQADPQVQKNAPLELEEAAIALAQAEGSLQRRGADAPEIEHLTYLAQRKTSLAVETAALRLAEQAVAQAAAERSEIRLAASTAETKHALEQARQEQLAAEQARQQEKEQRRTAEQALKEAKARAEEAEEAHHAAAEAEAATQKLERQLAELQACRTERGLVVTMDDVLFGSGKSELAAGAEDAISRLAAFLNENPTRRVQIEGFTDNVGDSEYNLDLSIKRAEAVRNALSRAGVALERILIEGYGDKFPVTSNDTADGKRRNRRVEAVISDERGIIPDRKR